MEWIVSRWVTFLDILPVFRWWDVFDILVVAFIYYRFLLLIRGTKAPQILTGLSLVVGIYVLSEQLEMRTISNLLGKIFDNVFILFVILFQSDIRRVLSQFGRTSFLSHNSSYLDGHVVDEVVKSAISMANKKVGALVVLEKEADVTEFIDSGVTIDSFVSKEILTSIFLPVSPIHDGAVIIRKGRIYLANCFLPLSTQVSTLKSIGTRHRAALGLTEETDAVCVVVSEENGSIGVATGGKMIHNLDASQLRKALVEYL